MLGIQSRAAYQRISKPNRKYRNMMSKTSTKAIQLFFIKLFLICFIQTFFFNVLPELFSFVFSADPVFVASAKEIKSFLTHHYYKIQYNPWYQSIGNLKSFDKPSSYFQEILKKTLYPLGDIQNLLPRNPYSFVIFTILLLYGWRNKYNFPLSTTIEKSNVMWVIFWTQV